MQHDVDKYLFDVRQACALIAEFTSGKVFADYCRDAMLRSAVERQFQIIGEALARIARLDAATSQRITSHPRIIAFRNILVHAYAQVDNRVVWGVIEADLATLASEVAALLGSDG